MAHPSSPDPDSRPAHGEREGPVVSAATSRTTRFEFGFGDKIAPRLGAQLDVFGDGRVKIYGSYGRYFDWVKYELARGTFGGDYWKVLLSPARYPERFTLNSNDLPGRDLWNRRSELASATGAFRVST